MGRLPVGQRRLAGPAPTVRAPRPTRVRSRPPGRRRSGCRWAVPPARPGTLRPHAGRQTDRRASPGRARAGGVPGPRGYSWCRRRPNVVRERRQVRAALPALVLPEGQSAGVGVEHEQVAAGDTGPGQPLQAGGPRASQAPPAAGRVIWRRDRPSPADHRGRTAQRRPAASTSATTLRPGRGRGRRSGRAVSAYVPCSGAAPQLLVP